MPSLETIRNRILQKTDNEYTDGFITAAEVDGLINLHYKRLYALLQRHGLHRVETEYSITATGATGYALPVDLYAVFTVHRDDGAGNKYYLRRHDQRDKPGPHQYDACTYRVRGGLQLELIPTPSSGSYVVTYIPVPPDLVEDDDTLDGVLGWEEYVVLAASIDVMVKESVDPVMISHVKGQLAELRADIRSEARDVEMSESPAIQNTRRRGDYPVDTARNVFRPGWRY